MQVYEQYWEIGCHTKFSKSIEITLKEALNYGMYCFQFFLGSPQSFKRAVLEEKDIENTLILLKRFPTKIYSHFPYLANLAGSVKKLAWNGDNEQDKKTLSVLRSIEYELGVLSRIHGGVVIHPGSFPDRKKGLFCIAQSINKINFPKNSKLLLENSAGQGTTLATTLEEISIILKNIKKENQPFVKVCIDTCHLFAYGEYDFRIVEEVDRFFVEFQDKIGLDKLDLIHLNDSIHPLKSRRDEHACLGQGYIWIDDPAPLVYFLDKCKELKVPCVLETHGIDMLKTYVLGKDK